MTTLAHQVVAIEECTGGGSAQMQRYMYMYVALIQVHLQCVVGGAYSQTAISAAICTLHPSHAEVSDT